MKTDVGQVQALFVAWQDQATKQYYPVGRLISGLRPDRPQFEYCYLRGARAAQSVGFAPLLTFQNLGTVYRSDELFPLFQNRLMPPSRAEYREYMANLDISDPEHADPMEVLVRSGGGRATDSLEMFEAPRVCAEGDRFQTHFLAHGIRYLNDASRQRILRLVPNERLLIQHDFQNLADPLAQSLRTDDRFIVGYLPRYLLGEAFNFVQMCSTVEVFVARVNPAPAPLKQHLLCRFAACWPPKVCPFCDNHYRPIPADATDLSCWTDSNVDPRP